MKIVVNVKKQNVVIVIIMEFLYLVLMVLIKIVDLVIMQENFVVIVHVVQLLIQIYGNFLEK